MRPFRFGGYAASCIELSARGMAGYQRPNVSFKSLFRVWLRTCNSRWAPRLVQTSLDTVMIYTEPNLDDLSARIERVETADVLSGE